MKPPAPGPVSGDSVTNDISTRRHGGVHGVAAGAQRLGAGLGGQRVSGCDHSLHGEAFKRSPGTNGAQARNSCGPGWRAGPAWCQGGPGNRYADPALADYSR